MQAVDVTKLTTPSNSPWYQISGQLLSVCVCRGGEGEEGGGGGGSVNDLLHHYVLPQTCGMQDITCGKPQ